MKLKANTQVVVSITVLILGCGGPSSEDYLRTVSTNAVLVSENKRLRDDLTSREEQTTGLAAENTKLKERVLCLEGEIQSLRRDVLSMSNEFAVAKARFQPPPIEATPEPKTEIKTGTIRLAVTFGVNNLLLRRPDRGAMVSLFPPTESPQAKSDNPFQATEVGAYFRKIDTTGETEVAQIPPGRYHLLITSSHATVGPNEKAANKKILSKYFTEKWAEPASGMRLVYEIIDVKAGQTLEKAFHVGED